MRSKTKLLGDSIFKKTAFWSIGGVFQMGLDDIDWRPAIECLIVFASAFAREKLNFAQILMYLTNVNFIASVWGGLLISKPIFCVYNTRAV